MESEHLSSLRPFIRVNADLSLHLARPELIDHIFAAVNNDRDYLRQWLPWVDATNTIDDTTLFINQSMQKNSSGEQLITFLVWKGQLAGSLGVVKFVQERKSCEIGYWLSSNLQGNGIMKKACKCLVGYLFKSKDLNRIEIYVASENLKSQQVCHRLGFKHEGTLRQALWLYDRFHDLELYALLKAEQPK